METRRQVGLAHSVGRDGWRASVVNSSRNGFTLIEVMIALVLVMFAASMTYVTFSTVTKAWRSGVKLTEDLHHGDFVMDQLVLGLRSAYYARSSSCYGFWLEKDGSGDSSFDSISWVKQGTALTESNSPTVAVPHRIRFSMERNQKGAMAPAVRYWRPVGLPDDFDPAQIQPQFLSDRIRGFSCRVATNTVDGDWEWSDIWEKDDTNKLPRAVELTLYLEPLDKEKPLVPMTRCIEIPVWPLSWGKAVGGHGSASPIHSPGFHNRTGFDRGGAFGPVSRRHNHETTGGGSGANPRVRSGQDTR